MPYATQQDLVDRYGARELIDLTDRADPPADAIDATVVGKALTDADALIDGYVAGAYDLPLPSTPPVLTRCACQIARFYLHKDRVSDEVRAGYDDAVKFLKDIAMGKARLDIGGDEPDGAPAGVQIESQDRVFDRATLKGF